LCVHQPGPRLDPGGTRNLPTCRASGEADRRIVPVDLEQGSSASACRRHVNIRASKNPEALCGSHRMHTIFLTPNRCLLTWNGWLMRSYPRIFWRRPAHNGNRHLLRFIACQLSTFFRANNSHRGLRKCGRKYYLPLPTSRIGIVLFTRQCVPSVGSSVRSGRFSLHSFRSAGFLIP
jgi:hypothetical protein